MNGNGRHQGGVLQQADEGVTQGGHGHQGGLGDNDPAHGLPLVQTQSPARLILALGDGAQGCTDDLGVIGALADSQGQDGRRDGIKDDAHIGQAKKDDEDLYDQRRTADDPDIEPGNGF